MVVALRNNGAIRVPQDVVVDACVPSGVNAPVGPIHPDSVLRDVVDPVVSHYRALLLRLHHLDNSPIGLDVCRVVYLVEHDLRRFTDPDGGRSTGLVHRVVREHVRCPVHHDGGHQALLVRTRPVDVVEV